MNNDWTTQRGQLDQALALERALHQARRRQQPSVGQAVRHGWASAVRWALGSQMPARVALTVTPQRPPL